MQNNKIYDGILFHIQSVQKKITDTFKTADDIDREIDHLHKMRLYALNTMTGCKNRTMVLAEITKCESALIVARETLQQNAPQATPQEAPQDVPQDAPQDVPQDAPQDVPQDTPQDVPQDTPHEASPASICMEMVD